jgi:hypothetical protein
MKLNSEEDNFFQLICAVSTKDAGTVRDVLKATLMAILINIYEQKSTDDRNKTKNNMIEFLIPYICKLQIEYRDIIVGKGKAVNVNLSAFPSSALISEITNILDNNDLQLIEDIQKSIKLAFNNILDVNEEQESCLG